MLQPQVTSTNSLDNQKTQPDIDIMSLVGLIWRKKWTIISLAIIVMVITAVLVMKIQPTYQATSTLLIENQQANVVSIEQIYGFEGGANYLQTQIGIMRSRAIIERAVKSLNLTTHPEFDPRQQHPNPYAPAKLINQVRAMVPGLASPEIVEELPEMTQQQIFDQVVNQLRARVSIDLVRGSNLVTISVQAHDRRLAAEAANAIAQAYIESQLDGAVEMTLMATNWMNNRLVELRETLKVSETRLQDFLAQENLIDLDGIVSISAAELSGLNTQLLEARRARAEIESEFQQVRQVRSQGWQALAVTPAVRRDSLLSNLRAEEARAQARIEELSQRYGPRHPAMMAASTDLDAIRSNIRVQVEQIVAGIERNYQIAVANETALRNAVEENKDSIQNISRNEFRLRELQREVNTNQVLFDTFLTRLKETSATQDLQTVNARIADPAVTPGSPIKPKKELIVAVAGLLTVMLVAGLILLLNMLNNTFKRSEDIENKLNLPVLGIMPQVKKAKDRSIMASLYLSETNRPFSESIKTIRTSIMLSAIDHPQPVIMFTSSIPGEGKSTTALSLAFALGQMQKVLLIEGDMRRPTMAKAFKIPVGASGLANVISGTADIDDAIQHLDGIDIMPAGLVPPNPLELLASEKFKTLMAELVQRYDRVIIDSPPVQAVSDALVLAKYADMVIYVVKADATPIPNVQKGVGQLIQHSAPVKGVVLNQVDIKKAQKAGYGYGGYYDYYGYSDPKKA